MEHEYTEHSDAHNNGKHAAKCPLSRDTLQPQGPKCRQSGLPALKAEGLQSATVEVPALHQSWVVKRVTPLGATQIQVLINADGHAPSVLTATQR